MRSRHNPTVRRRRQALLRPGFSERSRRRSRLQRPPHAARRAPYRAGLTLIELIVVMMILAICAVVVVPHVIRGADMQATAAARMLATDLQYAQDYAITTQDPVTVTFDISGGSYDLSNASGTLIHPMTKSAYQVDFSTDSGFEQVQLVSADFGGAATVTFDEIGSPDNAGNVVLQAGDYGYRVDVAAATGKVTVARQ